ncbi:MAG: hypothetical protein WBP93_18430 [Pyrinomonadaceae bacterium]
MKLRSEDITATHHPLACGYYALINLYQLRGIEPPSFSELHSAVVSYDEREGGDGKRGLAPTDQLRLLAAFGFPYFCAVSFMPLKQSPRACLAPFLDQGCALIVGYGWKRPDGRAMPHCVVVESYSDEGFSVIDSTAGYEEGSKIEFEPEWTPELVADFSERKAAEPRATGDNKLGIHPFFLIAYPPTESAPKLASRIAARIGALWARTSQQN